MSTNENRMAPTKRKTQMLGVALKLAETIGFEALTRDKIAEACGLSAAMVNVRFGTMTNIRRDVLRAAVQNKSLTVIAYGIVTQHPAVKKIDPELKEQALKSLSN